MNAPTKRTFQRPVAGESGAADAFVRGEVPTAYAAIAPNTPAPVHALHVPGRDLLGAPAGQVTLPPPEDRKAAATITLRLDPELSSQIDLALKRSPYRSKQEMLVAIIRSGVELLSRTEG